MNVVLTWEVADKLRDHIRSLMHHWHPDPNDSDYQCEFCGAHARTNQGEITHHDDCDGVELLQELQGAIAKAET